MVHLLNFTSISAWSVSRFLGLTAAKFLNIFKYSAPSRRDKRNQASPYRSFDEAAWYRCQINKIFQATQYWALSRIPWSQDADKPLIRIRLVRPLKAQPPTCPYTMQDTRQTGRPTYSYTLDKFLNKSQYLALNEPAHYLRNQSLKWLSAFEFYGNRDHAVQMNETLWIIIFSGCRSLLKVYNTLF